MTLAFTIERILHDAPEVDGLAAWFNREWGAREGFSLTQTRAWCSEVIAHPDEAFFVARAGRDVIGTSLLVRCDLETRRDLEPWLACVYVQPDHRARGVARRLVGTVEAYAQSRAEREIYLHTDSKTGPALLYEHLGWRRFSIGSHANGQVVIMKKSLTAGDRPFSSR